MEFVEYSKNTLIFALALLPLMVVLALAAAFKLITAMGGDSAFNFICWAFICIAIWIVIGILMAIVAIALFSISTGFIIA